VPGSKKPVFILAMAAAAYTSRSCREKNGAICSNRVPGSGSRRVRMVVHATYVSTHTPLTSTSRV